MSFKKIIISFILLFTSAFISNYLTKKGADKTISELERRYSAIEDSNIKLREQNKKLINTNERLREQLDDSTGIIKSVKLTIGELETGVAESTDIIERIERTVEAIGRIINKLPEEIVILEEHGNS